MFPPRRGQAESHAVRFPLAIFFPSLRFGQKLPFGLWTGSPSETIREEQKGKRWKHKAWAKKQQDMWVELFSAWRGSFKNPTSGREITRPASTPGNDYRGAWGSIIVWVVSCCLSFLLINILGRGSSPGIKVKRSIFEYILFQNKISLNLVD